METSESEHIIAQLKSELKQSQARVDAHVAYQEKTRSAYTQLAQMYEKLREEYASTKQNIESMKSQFQSEKDKLLNSHQSEMEKLQSQINALTQENKSLLQQMDAMKMRLEEELNTSRREKHDEPMDREMSGAEEGEEAHVVDVDDVNLDMLMPGAEPAEDLRRNSGVNEVGVLLKRIKELEEEKGELQLGLDELERLLEEEHARMENVEAMAEKNGGGVKRESDEGMKGRTGSGGGGKVLGVREVEELVATKLALAEADEEKSKLQYTVNQLRKQMATMVQSRSQVSKKKSKQNVHAKSKD
eukprot:CAMPEP_0182442786 /NCGR_PEP_ID=MMETSP1172-20130603/1660_1 /TAXON_ID=708627 /ORGANISM="Timspurckia oligopyrenoides, Strain CCMP3278" /LENGTH=301 /DNA_ID=CAMNT_0024637811 /DNA_START=215 /DNA_END=1120 /DNA_ORIENTATION=+